MAEKEARSKMTSRARVSTKKRVAKGDSVVCEVCGLSVVVEQIGDVAVAEETTLLCCGKPMKAGQAPLKAKASK